jgi:predicted enzyme related to lactoylglutathione lyase
VSGNWRTDRKPVNELGILIHIMVEDMTATLALIGANGGLITQAIGMDTPALTTRFSDPTGNVLGLYQHGV